MPDLELAPIFDALPEIVLSIAKTPQPVILYANGALALHTKYLPADLMGNPEALSALVHPDDRQAFIAMLQPGPPRLGRFRLISKDGKALQVEGSFSDIHTKNTELSSTQVVLRVLNLGVVFTANKYIHGAEGTSGQFKEHYLDQLALVAETGRTFGDAATLQDIYEFLGNAALRLFPDCAICFVSRYLPAQQQIAMVYGMVDGERQDITAIPNAELDHSAQGTQSKAILEKKPIIIPDLVEHRGGPANIGKLLGNEEKGQIPRSSLLVPIMCQNQVLGVVQVQSAIVERFSLEDANLLLVVANTAASVMLAITKQNQMAEAYDRTIEGWGQAVELRDRESIGHTLRVAELGVRLAKRLGIGGEELVNLRRGALMHDIGKLGVSDSILLKPGPLDVDEVHEMRKHPQFAYDMLKNISFMKDALDIPYAHHERWDGEGYPRGLRGNRIPMAARIFSLVDSYDAMLSDRPFRRAWSIHQVIEYIETSAGKLFDPDIAKEFLAMIREEMAEKRKKADGS